MLSRVWHHISFEKFSEIVESIAGRIECDLFLTSPGFPSEGKSYVCFEPSDEYLITDSVSRNDVANFAFSNDLLTFGFLSYQAGQVLNNQTITKPSDFPLGHLKQYFATLAYEAYAQELTLSSRKATLFEKIVSLLGSEDPKAELKYNAVVEQIESAQSFQADEYKRAVARTIDYIRNGYIYQLNLSIKYSVSGIDLDARRLFVDLWQRHPAPYYCFFESGNYQMISTSPECFLKVTKGNVLSQPIKGTLRFDEYKPELIKKLTESPKESSELSMIVDMIRNDIGKNCEYGSVKVTNHKSTFVVDDLIQMYSDVSGKLKSGKNCVDLLFDAFPGGSITGCPKKKAMELIDELEPHARDVYCGSFFVIKDERNLDSSIAIRTGYYNTASKQFCHFAGSGIVVDSIPESEYLETIAKAEKFIRAISNMKGKA